MQTSELPALVSVPSVERMTEGRCPRCLRVTAFDVGEFVMRKAGGVALILSGVAVGLYGIVEPWQLEATLSNASTAEQPARPATQVPEPRSLVPAERTYRIAIERLDTGGSHRTTAREQPTAFVATAGDPQGS
jgi:hypothetical protein